MNDIEKITATFSKDTLLMLRELLGNVTLPANHPDLVAAATQVTTALTELTGALFPEAATEA